MNDQNFAQQPAGGVSQPQQPVGGAAQPQQPFSAVPQPQPQQPGVGFGAQSQQPDFASASQPQQPFGAAAQTQQPFGAQPVAPPAGYTPNAQPGYAAVGSDQSSASTGKATAALVLGIAAIVICVFVPILGAPFGIALGIAAIVMCGSYIKVNGPHGRAKAGRICGIVGLVLSILSLLLTLALGALVGIVGMNLYDEFGTADIYEIIEEFDDGEYDYDYMFNGAIVPDSDSDSISSDMGDLTEDELCAVDAVSLQLDLLIKGDAFVLDNIGAIADQAFYEETGLRFADCGIDPLDYARAVTQGVSYVVDSVSLDGDTGYVTAYVSCKDVFDISGVVYEELAELASEPGSEGLSDEEYNKRAGEILMAAVRDAEVVSNCNWAVIDVERLLDGDWAILDETWDFEMDYMFSIV